MVSVKNSRIIVSCACLLFTVNFFFGVPVAYSQEIYSDFQGTVKARVIEVVESRLEEEGQSLEGQTQVISAEITDGEKKGGVITFENDYIQLKQGERFFLDYLITIDGAEIYSVSDTDRRPELLIFIGLFIATVIIFGGRAGIRSLIALVGSLLIIVYVLLPQIMAGVSPVLISVIVAMSILAFAMYVTHGINFITHAALLGTIITIIFVSIIAKIAVELTELTGFASDEAIYLSLNSGGEINLSGVLLGSIIIGVLGVLDDIAITQSAAVNELFRAAPHMSKKEVFHRASAIGKHHVGALVNTLALAYTGASLPLLLFFYGSLETVTTIINREIFAAEIIRTVVGSIGLVLTVPITTLLAVYLLKNRASDNKHSTHSH